MTEPLTDKIRVLFVDDERAILDGLKNLLRRYRHQWEMAFASSGVEALELLARDHHEVLISDLRMPGMDGATLLEQVRTRFPLVTRVVLSGHAESDAVMRCVPVAHQFLAKPCDPAALPKVIDRAIKLRGLVSEEALRALIAGLGSLPSPPQSYWQISRALASPDTGLDAVARLVQADPAVSAKLLQLANSAWFGLGREVSSVAQAVTYLGGGLIRDLVLATHLMSALEALPWSSQSLRVAFERTQLESRAVARLAQRISGAGPRGQAAFSAGLLHQLGKVVAAVSAPPQYERLLRQERGPDLPERERKLFGFTHTEAGGYLLGLWGLPAPIVESANYHRTPAEAEADRFGTVGAVHVAAALVAERLEPEHGAPELLLDLAWLQAVGVADKIAEWRELAVQELEGARAAAA